MHSHKCGLVDCIETARFGLTADDGCGYEWEHDPAHIESEEQNTREHHCPSCGRGPWYLKFKNAAGEILHPELSATYERREQ